MTELGWIYRNGDAGAPRDYKIARDWFNRGAALNEPHAFLGLALLHRYGEGVAKDLDKAREYFEKSASHGSTVAMRLLAEGLLNGEFGAPDRGAAIELLRRAADLADEEARAELGRLEAPEEPGVACDRLGAIEEDQSRPESVKPAVNYSAARAAPVCEAAVAAAPEETRYLNQLGRALIDLERYDQARDVLSRAAGKGSAFATLWIGNFYNRGMGVPKDMKQGFEWFAKAAGLGDVN